MESGDPKYNTFGTMAKQLLSVERIDSIDMALPKIVQVQLAHDDRSYLQSLVLIEWELPPNINASIANISIMAESEDGKQTESIFKPGATKGVLRELSPPFVDQVYKFDIKFKYTSGIYSDGNLWSKLWKTTKDCRDDEFYLDATGNNMMKWQCPLRKEKSN